MHPFSQPLFITTFQVVHGSTLNARIPWTSSPLAQIYIMCRGPLQSGHGPSLNTQYQGDPCHARSKNKTKQSSEAQINPICFAQSPPLLTYIGEPKGEALHLSTESSIFVSFHSFNFFCRGQSNSIKKNWTCEG